MSATTRRPSSSSTSATTTLAPSRAKMRAMLAPMPDAAPVIRATLSPSLIGFPSLDPKLNDGDLLPQLADKQILRDHRMDPAHDVDDLPHPKLTVMLQSA